MTNERNNKAIGESVNMLKLKVATAEFRTQKITESVAVVIAITCLQAI
jgi:hypothetical protein